MVSVTIIDNVKQIVSLLDGNIQAVFQLQQTSAQILEKEKGQVMNVRSMKKKQWNCLFSAIINPIMTDDDILELENNVRRLILEFGTLNKFVQFGIWHVNQFVLSTIAKTV